MESGQLTKTILIADDSDSSRDLLKMILLRAGCGVVEARDGEEALRKASLLCPDALILDLNMPCLDGYSVASQLRRVPFFADIPIIALSAAVSESNEARLREAGFTIFLEKPIAPAKLRGCIAELLNGGRRSTER